MSEEIRKDKIAVEEQASSENSKPGGESKQAAHEKKKKKTEPKDAKLKELQDKYNELNDKYLRLYSEFDNYRKRTQKERLELSKYASEEIILSLLPVLDDLDRALKAAIKLEDGKDVLAADGIRLIDNKFRNILTQKGLEPIPAVGEPFNVDYHDALTNIPAPSEDQKGKVMDEIEKGYTLNGKVIRYSKVVVGN